jgi:hypothetical protein
MPEPAMLILKRKIQIRIAENISLMSCHCASPIILLEQGDKIVTIE